ncbi:hypothetical protein D3C77_630840 [compost metagenome]
MRLSAPLASSPTLLLPAGLPMLTWLLSRLTTPPFWAVTPVMLLAVMFTPAAVCGSISTRTPLPLILPPSSASRPFWPLAVAEVTAPLTTEPCSKLI